MSYFPHLFFICFNPKGETNRTKQINKQVNQRTPQNSFREGGGSEKKKKADCLLFLKSRGPSVIGKVSKSCRECLSLNEAQSFCYYLRLDAFNYWTENTLSNLSCNRTCSSIKVIGKVMNFYHWMVMEGEWKHNTAAFYYPYWALVVQCTCYTYIFNQAIININKS